MHEHLAVHGMREQASLGVVEGQAGFVAGRFNT
jgi:hypothetical protein